MKFSNISAEILDLSFPQHSTILTDKSIIQGKDLINTCKQETYLFLPKANPNA